MNYLNVNDFKSFKDFWILEGEKINVVFSNAKMGRSFNRHTEDGIKNLLSLKEDFNVNEVEYINQIHSDKVYIYKKGEKNFIEHDGDGIVTLKVSATSLSDELKACIYVGPMGRDVEFGIIPKLETMSLIESIEEESTEETTENTAIEEIQDNEIMPISENNNTEENNSISKVILFGGVAILVIGIVCTIMLKRKK